MYAFRFCKHGLKACQNRPTFPPANRHHSATYESPLPRGWQDVMSQHASRPKLCFHTYHQLPGDFFQN